MLRRLPPILILAFAGSQALADPWAYVQQTPGKPFPKIHVYSDDGTQWDRVGDLEAGLTFNVDARGQCDSGWRTQHDSFLKVTSNNQDVALADLDISTNNRSYGPNHGSGWKSHTFDGPFANQQIPAGSAHHYCNAVLASESASAPNPAVRRRELLAQGFTRTLDHAYTAKFHLNCEPENKAGWWENETADESTDLRASVVCHGNPAALDVPLPPAQRDPVTHGIKAMDIWANPSASANYTGFCPKTIHFGGEVNFQLDSNQPFDLRYRFNARWGNNNIKSEVFTTKYTSSGKKFLHTWGLDFPLAGAGLQFQAPTASGEPDIFGGSVVLEFIGPVPINANLQAVPFEITCLKEGTVVAPVAGGGNLASPTRPRETINLNPQSPTRQPPPGQQQTRQATPGQPATGGQQPTSQPPTPGEPVTFTATVRPSPTSPSRATPDQPPAPAMLELKVPDLLISSVVSADRSGRALRVRVTNRGTGAAPASQLTLFLPDGTPLRTAVGTMPGRGQQDVIVRSPIPLTGTPPVRLQIDEAGRIAEADERNNTYVFKGGR